MIYFLLTSQFDPLKILSLSSAAMGLSGQLIIIPFLSFVGGTSGVKLQSKNSVVIPYIKCRI